MKSQIAGVLSTFLLLVAGLQLTLAQPPQGATNCRDIAAGLGTAEIAPATGTLYRVGITISLRTVWLPYNRARILSTLYIYLALFSRP
jgi:hypothetical protein